MIAVPGRGRRGDRSRLAAVPVLRPQRAQARPRDGRRQARVVQAETGGGFGGKEEYPSMIALHAALLAGAARRPVRMIYDRHEDIAATTKRHPAIVRHRTGVTRDGRLSPRTSRSSWTAAPTARSRPSSSRAAPSMRAARTAARMFGSAPGRPGPTRRRTARFAVSARRRPSSPPRPTSTGSPRLLASARCDPAAERLPAGDTTPTGQVLRDSVAAEGPRPRGRGRRVRAPPRPPCRRARPSCGFGNGPGRARANDARSRRKRGRLGARVARGRFHRVGRGPTRLGRVARADRRRRDRILVAATEMGQGTKTILPQLVAETLGVGFDDVVFAPQDTAYVPNSGPTVASRTAMVVGGLLVRAAETLRAEVEAATGGAFADTYRDYAKATRPPSHRPALRALSGRRLRRRDLPRRRLPGVRLGGLCRICRCRSRLGRGSHPRRGRRRRRRTGGPSGPRGGPGRGRHAPGDGLRDDRRDQAA